MSKKILIDLDENILEHITAKDVPLEMFDDICRAIENGAVIEDRPCQDCKYLLDFSDHSVEMCNTCRRIRCNFEPKENKNADSN